MENIFGVTIDELTPILEKKGYKKFTALQIYDWLYKKQAKSFDEMTNISKSVREELKNLFEIRLPKIVVKEVSKDKTTKYLFEFEDGSKVEGVLMYHPYGVSFCISSEVGCNMGCTFCASGLLKKTRNLTASDMVSMIEKAMDDSSYRIGHVVIMGTGEPLDNFENVLKFIRIINEPKGLEIGIRHITLSTCGLVPKIRELADMGLGMNLAISLHASNNELRSKLMPINRKYDIGELIDAVNYYFEKTSRRITFEYLLLDGINDQMKNADELSELIKNVNCYVNLIPYNHVDEFGFETTNVAQASKFYDRLKKNGINVTLRHKMGDDIDAACGQLRSKTE